MIFLKKIWLLAPILAVFFIINIPSIYAGQYNAKPDEAEYLYKKYGNAVYQIEVVDIASGKKTSIGSGFQISPDGLMATNYHVVAEKINRPENNRIEFVNDQERRGALKILQADVVNDLALLRMDKAGESFLDLQNENLAKGTKIFSIGNPHDIGFTIIEGTYNGVAKEGMIDKIHFSGSLNPGMSGGPAISHEGVVVGINVATAGNQISFLVPVQHLINLTAKYAARPKAYDFMKNSAGEIEAQLLAKQDKDIKGLLNRKWAGADFAMLNVPGKISNELKCWGGINHKEDDDYKFFYSICSNQDRIFLDQDFDTGAIAYRYNYLVGEEKMFPTQFYNLYQRQYAFPDGDFKNAKKEDVTDFECNDNVVNIADAKWKVSFCVRQYKKYPRIFDLHLYSARLGEPKAGFSTALIAQGISKDNALALSERFIKEIKQPEAKEGKKK